MIQWYPGHMKKARDEITQTLPKVDVVIEMRDARLPESSRNPVLDELRRGKPCLRILSKKDLADPDITLQWIAELEKEKGIRAFDAETHDSALGDRIIALCRKLAPPQIRRPVKTMIVGIPNVGKSTLLNTLAGRRLAKVGNQPAVTRNQQIVTIGKGKDRMDILDTPGILWPNLADRKGAFRLAVSGAVKDTAMDYREAALFAAVYLMRNYPEILINRYSLKGLPDSPFALIEEIGRRKGCLLKGGVVDEHRASERFIHDFRTGQMGRISLEKPLEDDGDDDPASGASPQETPV
jgi:ribosome biogenesis GTPase A